MIMIKVINPKNGLSKEINGEVYTYGDFKIGYWRMTNDKN